LSWSWTESKYPILDGVRSFLNDAPKKLLIDGVWVDNVQLHVLGNCGHCVQLGCQRDFERFVIDLDGLN
jgi:hypothetical protein